MSVYVLSVKVEDDEVVLNINHSLLSSTVACP